MHILLLLAVALFQLALTHLVAASPCDAVSCKLPSCTCPSVNPPGGIAALDAPQFVTLTFDDAIQPASYQIATDLLNLKNPNGCPAKGTWFATVQYGDPSLAQQWYAAGNEVAAHTFNHIGDPSEGNKRSRPQTTKLETKGKKTHCKQPFFFPLQPRSSPESWPWSSMEVSLGVS